MTKLILASKSPRRFELLSMTGLSFEVENAHVDEDKVLADVLNAYKNGGIRADMYQIAQEVACAQAQAKAAAVLKEHEDAIIIGSDTVVVTEKEILGKPSDEADAHRMLEELSGRTHRVYTGVSVQAKNEILNFYSYADVTFHALDTLQKHLIGEYIASGSPMDKAGAYGIQDAGSLLIDSISGDYYAVVGLPVARLLREMREMPACEVLFHADP